MTIDCPHCDYAMRPVPDTGGDPIQVLWCEYCGTVMTDMTYEALVPDCSKSPPKDVTELRSRLSTLCKAATDSVKHDSEGALRFAQAAKCVADAMTALVNIPPAISPEPLSDAPGTLYVVCNNDALLSASFDEAEADREVKRLKKKETDDRFFFHTHEIPMLTSPEPLSDAATP